MHRYFVMIWDPTDPHSGVRAAATESEILNGSNTWAIAYRNDGALVLHQEPRWCPPHTHLLAYRSGLVLGTLFHRTDSDTSRPVGPQLTASETQRIVESAGRELISSYWGSYIALVRDSRSGSFAVLRDPTGTLACYYASSTGLHAFFSHIEDLCRYLPMSLSINWSHVAKRLLGGIALSRDCGLNEIEDVPGGEWVTISGRRTTRTLLWQPSQFCLGNTLEDSRSAIRELRSTVLNSVKALGSRHSDILVRLSGGLDSSIVTTALSHQERAPTVTCLNFYISNTPNDSQTAPVAVGLNKENLAKFRRLLGSSDERDFARTVATKCGFNLVEREKRERDIDFTRIWSAPLAPRPSGYVFFMDEDDSEMECATKLRATACFTGEAGDTVFYCTFRAIGALDYAYNHPFGSRLFDQIASAVKLSGESPARVLSKVVKYGYLRAPLPLPIDPATVPHLLSDEVAASAASQLMRHPWLDAAPPLCPGKHQHVMGVALSVPCYHLVYHREQIATSVHPLASQPVVETCLRIPTYVLLADGVSRGLARRAFQDLLPPEVARRTVKGLPMAFRQRLVRNNVAFIRECLLDGLLSRERLLDRRKLEDYLIPDQAFLTVEPHRIMDYMDCEAWLSHWPSGSIPPRPHARTAI